MINTAQIVLFFFKVLWLNSTNLVENMLVDSVQFLRFTTKKKKKKP